jgi:hypothetical protein
MTYFQSQSLNQLNVKTCMHTYSFDLYLHLSHLILIHNTHILINQWEFKRIKHRFFFYATKKTKILSILFFLDSRKPHSLESALCGPRWASKTLQKVQALTWTRDLLCRSQAFYHHATPPGDKILSIPPYFKHNIVLNVEMKEKEYKRMTKIK